MTLSAVMFAIQAAIVRHLSKELHFLEISLFRALFGIVIMLPWLMRVGISAMRTRHSRLYVCRGLLSTVAMYGWFGGVALIPIADATAISFTFPLFIALFGVLFLREPFRRRSWLALLVGFLGTLIVIRPGFQDVNIGAVMVVGAGLLIACTAMILKVTLRTDRPDTAALYQSVYMLPFATLGAAFVWTWPDPEQWLWGFALGAASTTAQRFYSRAFAIGDASAVAPFDFSRLLFAILIGFVAFSELPDIWTVVGAIVIFSASIFAGRRDRKPGRNTG